MYVEAKTSTKHLVISSHNCIKLLLQLKTSIMLSTTVEMLATLK